jgi:hypothetical protein
LQHLRHYPDQVLILRGAPEVVREQDKLGLAFTSNDLVDRAQTDHFAQFCRDIDAAVQGDSSLVHQIQLQGKAAATQLVTFRGGAVNVAKGIKGIAEKLDADRLKRIRNNAQFTASDIEWFLAVLKQLATIMIEDYPYATRWPEPDALRESWIFRYALAGCLLMRWWIQNGGLGSALGLGNDMIDMTIATNGTYFDGVWTKDNKLGDIHAEMRWVLEEGWKL